MYSILPFVKYIVRQSVVMACSAPTLLLSAHYHFCVSPACKASWKENSLPFDRDDFAKRHGFELVEMRQPSDEWSPSWRELWSYAAQASA